MNAASALLIIACCCAGATGWLLSREVARRREATRRRRDALHRSGVTRDEIGASLSSQGVARSVIVYLMGLGQRLSHGSTVALSSKLPDGSSRARNRFAIRARRAGLQDAVSWESVCEGRLRLAAVMGGVGLVLGACLSNELAVLLAIAGAVAGACAPGKAVGAEADARARACTRELPELLEVVSLGLRSGLTFDRSFSLYHAHFDTGFAQDCAAAQRKWSAGFATREEALRDLAAGYDSALLDRVVENVVRSLRFGTTLAADLEKAAADSHAEQRAARQEEVAKAPVKMMVPTAGLILPAMLLLVLGPVLLELMNGF